MITRRDIDIIVDEYSDMLYKLAMHHIANHAIAQDIVQDTFMKYLYKAPTFNDIQHEKAWLIRVTSNLEKWKDTHKDEYDVDLIEDENIVYEVKLAAID